MDDKLIDKANEELNETFVLFNELIKNIETEDEELAQIFKEIQLEVEND